MAHPSTSDDISLALDQLKVESGFNARVEYGDIVGLAVELMTQGQLNPIRVRKEHGQYYVVDGHRRRQAFELTRDYTIRSVAGRHQLYCNNEYVRDVPGPVHPAFNLNRIACKLTPADVGDVSLLTMQLTANGGKPLTPLEKTLLVSRLFRMRQTKEQVILRTGLSRTYIANALSLQGADNRVLELVTAGKVSQRLALRILRAFPSEEQLAQVTSGFERAATHGRDKILPKDLDLPTRKAKDQNNAAEPTLFSAPEDTVEDRLSALHARAEELAAVASAPARDRIGTVRVVEDYLRGRAPLTKVERHVLGTPR